MCSTSLPLLLLCGVVMSASMQPSSGIVYLVILGAMLCAGTISYDEMDHGYSFLFTLPPSRREYVREKYLFCAAVCLICMVIGFLISAAVSAAKGMTLLTAPDQLGAFAAGAVLAAACMLGMLIPVRLKYGTEKSSIVLFAFFGLAAAGVLVVTRAGGILPEGMVRFVKALPERFGDGGLLLGLVLVSVLILLVSEQISERIVTGKEY